MVYENPQYKAEKFFQEHPEVVNTWETFRGIVESLLGSKSTNGFLKVEQKVLTNLAQTIFLPEEYGKKAEFLSIVKLFRQTAYHDILADCRGLQSTLKDVTNSRINGMPYDSLHLRDFSMQLLELSYHVQSYLSTFAHAISTGYHLTPIAKKFTQANVVTQRALSKLEQITRQNLFGVPELYEEESN